MTPFPTRSDKPLKKLLIDELVDKIVPLLEELGFRSFPPPRRNRAGFPTNYYRKTPDRIDIVQFQWERHGTPAFIINFDIIDDLGKLTTKAKDASDTWFVAPPYRAGSVTRLMERWFKIGHLARIFTARLAARREVLKARQRIIEINIYAEAGKSSPYFRTNHLVEKMPDVDRSTRLT